jgi:hypothetical protein
MNENKSYKNMELKFNKNGDAWVAEFEATDKFNLHMEGLLLGSFSILQRTAGGKYTHVRDIPTYPRFDKVFDYDFNALVYPKFIKIVSETEPTYAEVVSDGEITEIKSQTKEVEVTANGTTQVAPDAGYSYLTRVTVKTNVPQSSGSGGESTGMKYYLKPETVDDTFRQFAGTATQIAKVDFSGSPMITMPLALLEFGTSLFDIIIAIGVNPSTRVVFPNASGTISELYGEIMATLTEITEEEFYNLG